MIDFDKVIDDLDRRRARKKDIDLARAHSEISAINREYEAYVDGLYDAVKAIKVQYAKEKGERE